MENMNYLIDVLVTQIQISVVSVYRYQTLLLFHLLCVTFKQSKNCHLFV